MVRAVLFSLLLLTCVAGCDKKNPAESKKILIICQAQYNLPAVELAAEFKKKTGVDAEITIAAESEIRAILEFNKSIDILIADDPFLQYVSDKNSLAAVAEAGFDQQNTPDKPSRRILVIGLSTSKNSMGVMRMVECARRQAPDIFARHGFE